MKRQGEGGHDRGAKRGRTGKVGKHAFKALCPDHLVVKLMGERGTALHNIEERTSSHLQFSQRGDYYPGTSLRVLTASASTEQDIMDALTILLDESIDCAHDVGGSDFVHDDGRYIFKGAVSKEMAGGIIGNGGRTIRQLRESTGAAIDVDRDVLGNHQLVTVKGGRDEILTALADLNRSVQKDSDKSWFPEWAAQRTVTDTGQGSSGSGYKNAKSKPRDGDRRGGRRHIGEDAPHCTIFVGRLAQATDTPSLRAYFGGFGTVTQCDVRMDNMTGRSKGFGFVTFSEENAVEACLARHDHMIDHRAVDVKRYGDDNEGTLARDRDEAGDTREDEYNPEDDAGVDAEQDGGAYSSEPFDDLSGSGAFSGRGEDGLEWKRENSGPLLSLFNELAETMNPEHLEMDYQISCCIQSAKCGALIGRQGEHVREVQRQTGAHIDIPKKDPHETPDATRTIAISGPLLAVYSAHMLLMRYYNEEEQQFREAQAAQAREAEDQDKREEKIQDLQAKLAELTQELGRMNRDKGSAGKGKGGGGGKGKGGAKGGARRR